MYFKGNNSWVKVIANMCVDCEFECEYVKGNSFIH